MFKCLSNLYYNTEDNIFESTNINRKKEKKKEKKSLTLIKYLSIAELNTKINNKKSEKNKKNVEKNHKKIY